LLFLVVAVVNTLAVQDSELLGLAGVEVVDRTVFSEARRLESVRLFIEGHFLRLEDLSLFTLNQVLSVADAVLKEVL
jgi:hypothetical protein